jgi:hypothetical protein
MYKSTRHRDRSLPRRLHSRNPHCREWSCPRTSARRDCDTVYVLAMACRVQCRRPLTKNKIHAPISVQVRRRDARAERLHHQLSGRGAVLMFVREPRFRGPLTKRTARPTRAELRSFLLSVQRRFGATDTLAPSTSLDLSSGMWSLHAAARAIRCFAAHRSAGDRPRHRPLNAAGSRCTWCTSWHVTQFRSRLFWKAPLARSSPT